jgi:hypothetical protein
MMSGRHQQRMEIVYAITLKKMCGGHLLRDAFFKALQLVFQCPHHYIEYFEAV